MSYRPQSLMISLKFLLALIGCATAAGLLGQAEVGVPENESTEAQETVEDASVLEKKFIRPRFLSSCESLGYTTPAPDYVVVHNVPNSTACRYRCRSDDRCVWYTYNWIHKNCYLKDTVMPKGFSDSGNITGPKKCDFPCFEWWTKSDAPSYSEFTGIRDPKICQEKCNADRRCAWWNYELEGKCQLKSTQGNLQSTTGLFFTGAPYCETCELVGQTGSANDYKTLENIDGMYTCRAHCRQDPKCYWYTYNQGKKLCFLKEFRGPLRQSEPDDVTAPAECSETCSARAASTRAADYELIEGIIPNEDACRFRCKSDVKCRWWTYNRDAKKCFLKAEIYGISPSFPNEFTGPEECEKCEIVGKTSNARDIKVTQTSSTALCRLECRRNPDCVWFTYNSRSQKCFQKRDVGQIVGQMAEGDITGPVICSSP